MDDDQVPSILWSPESRRTPATASNGNRPGKLLPDSQRRPFTSIGASLFHLDATRSDSARERLPQPSDAGAEAGEFNVRKFLLDQKKGLPLHKSSLFRSASSDIDPTSVKPHAGKKKILPRMDQAVANGHTKSTPLLPMDDTVSHFYTIEKLAESCFHAVQSKHSKTWQFLPGAEERSKNSSGFSANASSGGANSLTNIERPSRRVDVVDLDKCFDLAMHFVRHKPNGDSITSSQLSTLERDVMTIESKVAQRYVMCKVNTIAATGDLSGQDLALNDNEALSDEQKKLARTLFEQKWSDVVLGEVEAMLTSSFLEQGVLLRKTRIQYAKSFFKLEKLYTDRTKALARALSALNSAGRALHESSESHALDTQLVKSQYEEQIRQLSVNFESRRDDMERKAAESKEQMAKMGDTMKTLNTIFRQMREDTDKVKAIELRENYIKLERKYEACKEELERLRPLVQINQKLHEQKAALQTESQELKDKIACFDPLIASKDEVIASLMEQQSELLAAQELRTAQDEERIRFEDVQVMEQEEDGDDPDSNQAKAGSDSSGRRQSASGAVVCVRCKENLRNQSQVGLLTASSNQQQTPQDESDTGGSSPSKEAAVDVRKRRVQCMYFRILLPNLRGRRPQRELAWTLSCMRAIVFAKQLDDAMCKAHGGAFPTRIRMPEFVYSWFSPWKSLREEKGHRILLGGDDLTLDDAVEGGQATSMASIERADEQRQMQADEDRWCLYYGVRALVQEGYLEAKLFLSLLDEKHGEDEQVFMFYCYRVLDVLLGGRLNYGPLRDHVSYESFYKQYDTLFASRHSSSELLKTIQSRPKVPKTIWITPYHASLATDIVLGKATDSERAGVHKKLLEFAVTNLAEDERPAIYLTPASASALRHSGKIDDATLRRASRPRHDEDDSDDEVGSSHAVQFVDAHLWVELMMMEYKEEQAHRRAAIRLMFQTATAMSNSTSLSLGRASVVSGANMDMEQFRIMICTLNDEFPSFMAAALYRTAFLRGNGSVNFDSFLEAAEYTQFFSSCMRLENPSIAMSRLQLDASDVHAPTSVALSTSARAAFVVDKLFTLMHKQIESLTRELPLWTRSLTDTLVYELSTMLIDGGSGSSGGSDGVVLLTSFHRLVEALLLANLTKKDATGLALSSKSIFSFEKALHALLECVRVGDKSSIEQLMDTVRQKLSVQRVQGLFRKYLERDAGAPLVMRPLLHRGYGAQPSGLRSRRAERPLKWLQFVFSDVLRRSLRSDRVHWLLVEMSSVSSVLLSHGAQSPDRGSNLLINGGIGVSPRPLFVEIMYDSFIDKFGTRLEAEKLIHDTFFNCRAILDSNSLARLFSYLCGMSNSSTDDRMMAQNEALAFLHAVFRCGLHPFSVINPRTTPSKPDQAAVVDEEEDLICLATASRILDAAFVRLSADQKTRMRMRLEEKATIWKTPGLVGLPDTKLTGSFALPVTADLTPKPFLPADLFLVAALHEWKMYLQHRLNELRIVCLAMEAEIAQFGHSLPVDVLTTLLQKAGVTASNEDLCVTFRRLNLTEPRVARSDKPSRASSSSAIFRPHMSDRVAAACYPLIAKETLIELQHLESTATTSFKLVPTAEESAKFLVETWRAYTEPCRLLLDELRRIGKNNDIQVEAISRRAPINGGRATQREVLHLSTSTSTATLSSQDVTQLDALYTLFFERLNRMNQELGKNDVVTQRRASIKMMNDLTNARKAGAKTGSMVMDDDAREALLNSHALVVNETWKVFRQLIVSFTRLRSLAGIGDGPLPDKWDLPDVQDPTGRTQSA